MDISAFIVGLGVTLLIAAFESSGKKSKKSASKTPPPRRAPLNAHVGQATPPSVQPKRKPQQQNQPGKQTATKTERKPFLSGDEGVRMSAASGHPQHESVKQAVKKNATPLRPLTRDNLRNAVIWSEILRPKF